MSTLFVNNLNTASGTTITVPTGKQLIGTDTNSIKAPGMILNVQSVTMRDNQTFAGTAFTDLNDGTNALSITMTPTSSSSKFLLYMMVSAGADNGNSRFGFRFMRGSTIVGNSDTIGNRTPSASAGTGRNGNNLDRNISMIFLDSPATSSAVTYKIQGSVESTSSTLCINRGGQFANDASVYTATSSFTVMEIAQ